MTVTLGALKLFTYLLCNIIGIGIFVVFPVLLEQTKSFVKSILSLLLSSLVIMAFGLCYSELGATYPAEGGDAVYLHKAYHISMSIIYSTISVYIILPLGIALMLKFIMENIGIPKEYHIYVALIVIIILVISNWLSGDMLIKFQYLLTILKVFVIGIFILFAILTSLSFIEKNNTEDSAIKQGSIGDNEPFYKIFIGSASIVWAFDGWNAGNFIAHRVRTPGSSFPIAIVSVLCVVTLIYILFGVSFCSVLSFEQIINNNNKSSNIVTNFFKHLRFNSKLKRILCLCINIIPPLGTLNGSFIAASSIIESFTINMQQGNIFKLFGLIGCGIVIFIGILEEKSKQLVNMMTIMIYIWYGLSIFAILLLRRKDATAKRPFKVPSFLIYFCLVSAPVVAFISFLNYMKSLNSNLFE